VQWVNSFGGDGPAAGDGTGPRVAGVEDIEVPRPPQVLQPRVRLARVRRITKCAYFDYSGTRCSSAPARRPAANAARAATAAGLRGHQVVVYEGPERCPHCGSDDFGVRGRYSRLLVDLKPVGAASSAG